MLRRTMGRSIFWLVPLAAFGMAQSAAFGQTLPNSSCPTHQHCPPAYRHIYEGAPNIHFKCGCPKPICPPCTSTERWGYYETCWRRWPWPPNWSHCPVPPPGAYFDGTIPMPPANTPGALHMPGIPPSSSDVPLTLPALPRLSMDTPPGR